MKSPHHLFPVLLFLASLAMTAAAQDPPSTDVFLVSLSRDAGSFELGRPVNITERPGYDNQPYFDREGGRLFYTAIDESDQADIWIYDLTTKERRRLTETAESEYSPTPIPGEDAISVVRVEADGQQRLWRFPLDGGAADLLLPNVEPVGYHAWSHRKKLALFVLGEPITLQRATRGRGKGKVLAENIGRSLHRIPGGRKISFVHKEGEKWTIRSVHLASGKMEKLVETRPEREDYAWTPTGEIWMGDASVLYVANPARGEGFRAVADFAEIGLSEITRLAVDPAGERLAFVALPGS